MAQHKWRTWAELEKVYAEAGLDLLLVAEYGCVRCGAMRNLGEGDQLPAEGCLDLDGGALPA